VKRRFQFLKGTPTPLAQHVSNVTGR
jgi:hypothetical protein